MRFFLKILSQKMFGVLLQPFLCVNLPDPKRAAHTTRLVSLKKVFIDNLQGGA
jgi:hypothetical protein